MVGQSKSRWTGDSLRRLVHGEDNDFLYFYFCVAKALDRTIETVMSKISKDLCTVKLTRHIIAAWSFSNKAIPSKQKYGSLKSWSALDVNEKLKPSCSFTLILRLIEIKRR